MQDTAPPTTEPEAELPAAIRRRATDAELLALGYGSEAQTALDARNYSAAATACHRAHQEHRISTALRALL